MTLWHWLITAMQRGLDIFYGFTGSYGLAIVLLTVVIRIILLPFTIAQTKSMAKMQGLNPLMEDLKRKYKNDPERLNREMMELWKKHGVNPMSGCLPLLLQFPFLIALFQALQTYQYLYGASFLWIPHLAKPDPYYILPVLAGATTYWQTKAGMPAADKSQWAMTVVMPIMIGWISINFPAGLAVYWVTQNLFSIVQQYAIPKPGIAKGEARK